MTGTATDEAIDFAIDLDAKPQCDTTWKGDPEHVEIGPCTHDAVVAFHWKCGDEYGATHGLGCPSAASVMSWLMTHAPCPRCGTMTCFSVVPL